MFCEYFVLLAGYFVDILSCELDISSFVILSLNISSAAVQAVDLLFRDIFSLGIFLWNICPRILFLLGAMSMGRKASFT